MNKLLKAAIKHYEAQKSEAEAILDIYFNDSVGIGEHSKLLEEINEWTHKLSEAEENIEVLKKYFEDDGYVRDNPTKGVLNG